MDTNFNIDDAWMSFMNNSDDDDDIDSIVDTMKSLSGPASRGVKKPVIPTKKTTISKKQQRKTYSFVDSPAIDFDAAEVDAEVDVDVGTISRDEPASIIAAVPAASLALEKEKHCVLVHSRPRPTCTPIYISTKTKISYLNKPVDIKRVFWEIPITQYSLPVEGVIKKQIKFYTTNPDELAEVQEKLRGEKFYEDHIIEHIENPEGRIKFKDQRKISIGLSRKDIISYHCKKKRAFFNCFVVILRVFDALRDAFKEMHIKVFNTGKLEIPGIQDDAILNKVLVKLVEVLRPLLGEDLDYLRNRCETVLINSNFNCGYYINRDQLYDILKYKYRINSNYDACSYPGIQCKFYYIPGIPSDKQTGQQPNDPSLSYYEISFMIFRTGSILIVGKCNERILTDIYLFIKNMLENEYEVVANKGDTTVDAADAGEGDATQSLAKKREVKMRKRVIIVNVDQE